MSKTKVIVTGGAGFIGSHTVVELIGGGYDVVVIDNFSNAHDAVPAAIGKITGTVPLFERTDMCDRAAVREIFLRHRPDAVIHFAASKMVGESVENPLMYYYNNLVSLISLLEACSYSGCRQVVFSSSCTVYGQPDQLPVTEQAPLKKAESPYGNTKKIGEDILSDFIRVNPAHAISLRYFNPVGAHPSALIGEYPLGPPSNLMPVITQTAAGRRASFEVFGTDYQTSDGTCVRDYIHVCDVAAAHVAAIGRMRSGGMKRPFEIFNLGTGTGISVLEMIACFERVNNIKLNYSLAARRPGDVARVWADTSLANRELGWKALKSLEHMVADAWAWERRLSEMAVK
jgi:UDP-glucose 4-epimerase